MDQVEEVKQKTDIVSVISERITLKKAGRNYKANCPFHGEKTPSFMVSPELQIFKCFGCSKSGDAISFLEEYEGMDFYEALKYLAKRAGVELKTFGGREFSDKEKLYQANTLASKYYQYVLLNHPSGRLGLNYLTQKRGIKSETIKTFGLGFAPNTPQALSRFLISKKKFTPELLEKAGISFKGRGGLVDRFRGRIIFPLFDHRGNSIGLAGRLLPEYESKDVGKYINSPETPIYHKGMVLYGLNITRSEIKKAGSAVIVEGEIDLISVFQAGVKNIVAIKGTALTSDQVRVLARVCGRLILALDADIAGDMAARRGIAIAQAAGLEVRVVRPAKFKDPDEFARSDPEGFKKAIANAVNVWDFLIESIFSKADPETGEGKAKISREIVPVLASIYDKIVAAHYVKKTASLLGVGEETVGSQIEKYINIQEGASRAKEVLAPQAQKSKTRRELLEERLVSLALLSDPDVIKGKEISLLVTTPWAKRVVSELQSWKGKFNLQRFTRGLPPELSSHLAELILEESKEETTDDKMKKELILVIEELKEMVFKETMAALSAKISQAESKGDEKSLTRLKKEFADLTSRLAQIRL